ncbi:MAG: hypothetical protein IPH48_07280 [bacterium]|nr:hypothetical protein [bacterium]
MNGARVGWVVKFGELHSNAAQAVCHEGNFLKAVCVLPQNSPIRAMIPNLVGTGDSSSVTYLVTEFANQIPAHAWLPRSFRKRPAGTIGWFIDSLAFLDNLHSDSVLKESLNVPYGSYIAHGDYHFMNVLGAHVPRMILDWEDWAIADVRYRDAILCIVMPTLVGESVAERLESFRRHWVRVSPWAQASTELVGGFLDGVLFGDALVDTLEVQSNMLALRAPVLSDEFRTYAGAARECTGR